MPTYAMGATYGKPKKYIQECTVEQQTLYQIQPIINLWKENKLKFLDTTWKLELLEFLPKQTGCNNRFVIIIIIIYCIIMSGRIKGTAYATNVMYPCGFIFIPVVLTEKLL